MRYWSHYWERATVSSTRRVVETEGASKPAVTSSNLFESRGVAPGDLIYVISFRNGRVELIRRLHITRLLDTSAAERLLEREMWPATDHAVCGGRLRT